jgi:WD40 repeat protein
MYNFDRVVIDPTPKALKETLAAAVPFANKGYRVRLLTWPPDDFAAFVRKWRAAPEGQRQWSGRNHMSTVAVAWWSDPLGRKHCRVVAAHCPADRDLFWPERDHHTPPPQRPVLWRVYPDDLYLREEAGEWRLWAVCRCGTAGPPEKLGWMGPWCAACHDRAEEGCPQTRPGSCRPVVFAGHPSWVNDVIFTPDGRLLLVHVPYHPTIWLWDTVTGLARKKQFPGRPGRSHISGMCVAPDGRTAAVCVEDQVFAWSLLDGSDIAARSFSLDYHTNDQIALAFNPDGSLLAAAVLPAGYSHGRIMLHDSATGQAVRTFAFPERRLHWGRQPLAFSPDGSTLALGWGEPIVRRWDVASGQELPAFPGDLSSVAAVGYSPDGKILAAGLDLWGEDYVRLWNATTGEKKATFEGPVAGLAFSPDSRLLATAGGDGCLRLRQASTGRLLGTFCWHQSDIDAVAFSPDGRWLATGAKEDRVKLWPVDALLGHERRRAAPRRRTRPRMQ